MTRPSTYSAQGRCRGHDWPEHRPRRARKHRATTNLTAFTRSSRATSTLALTTRTDYYPHSFSSSNVRARAQHESSSTRSTDLPVALAPPADVNKHGSS